MSEKFSKCMNELENELLKKNPPYVSDHVKGISFHNIPNSSAQFYGNFKTIVFSAHEKKLQKIKQILKKIIFHKADLKMLRFATRSFYLVKNEVERTTRTNTFLDLKSANEKLTWELVSLRPQETKAFMNLFSFFEKYNQQVQEKLSSITTKMVKQSTFFKRKMIRDYNEKINQLKEELEKSVKTMLIKRNKTKEDEIIAEYEISCYRECCKKLEDFDKWFTNIILKTFEEENKKFFEVEVEKIRNILQRYQIEKDNIVKKIDDYYTQLLQTYVSHVSQTKKIYNYLMSCIVEQQNFSWNIFMVEFHLASQKEKTK